MMYRISQITKRDIFKLLEDGIDITNELVDKKMIEPYFGQLDELEFLLRIYDVNSMPSFDSRFSNATDDIWQHTINNDDYPYGWVFEDERFQLKEGNDVIFLKFICEVFHPEVRFEKGYWKELLSEVNELLRSDGYELYSFKKISGRNVYNWRLYHPEDTIFIPFSQRNKKAIKQNHLMFKITRNARKQIYHIFKSYDYQNIKISETGWQSYIWISEEVFNEIKKFYTPKNYNKENQYVKTTNLKDFILFTSPYSVVDAIEFFYKYNDSKFEAEINAIFKLNDIPLKLDNNRVETITNSHITISSLNLIEEVGLKELIQVANRYYEKNNLQIAVEKLWDAFERLKTYYSPTLDKKKSAEKIIDDMSGDQEPFKKLFEKEFSELTSIGNDFRIRHHEVTKIDIEDDNQYEYFYKRCHSLITHALKYLDNRLT